MKPKGAAFVSRALETVLRKFPVEASTMLAEGGVIKQVRIVRKMILDEYVYHVVLDMH